jgi:hypothetical protein
MAWVWVSRSGISAGLAHEENEGINPGLETEEGGDAHRGVITVPPNVGEPLKHRRCNMRRGLPVGGG